MSSPRDVAEPSAGGRRLRVLLVYPPSRTQVHSAYPLGITVLGGVLERAGHEVRLVDANAALRRRSADDLVELVRAERPDVVGMTLITPIVRGSYALAERLRALGPKLLAGGPHATLVPEEPLAHGFDATLPGEAEGTIEAACRALVGDVDPRTVPGLVFRDAAGAVVRNPPAPPVVDLDTLPLPARHLHDPADYVPAGDASLHQNLFSSRGCTARCTYCAGALFGKRFRFRSADHILAEIRDIRARWGTSHFHFVDDAMSVDKGRMRALCEGLLALDPRPTFSLMTRIDLTLDRDLVALMARAGCTRIDFGVESGDPDTLRKIKKPHTVDMVRRVLPEVARLGIDPHVFFILGFPWDDHASIAATRRHMEEIAPHVASFDPAVASVLVPFPGTRIYDEYKDRYGFAEWWLREDRSFDAPTIDTHSYFETKVFVRGAALDADFFEYPEAIKSEIRDVFRLMYALNLRRQPPAARLVERALVEASARLAAISPRAERAILRPILRARSAAADAVRRLRGAAA